MILRRLVLTLVALPLCVALSHAQTPTTPPAFDLTGKWTATFDTQIGPQNYTYEFATKDGKLTGTATNDIGQSVITDVKVEKDVVTFSETLKYMDMDIAITYSGKVVSPDEIKFTRNVMEFATEDLVAKRVKK